MTEAHLGGHFGVTHTDPGSLLWAKKQYGVDSMLDIGCSVGGQVITAVKEGGYARAVGVDGDREILQQAMKKNCNGQTGYICHDFCNDVEIYPGQFDLVWCVEVLEHIYDRYLQNVLNLIETTDCKLVICTAAAPDQPGGYHHVNCRPQSYWIDKFASIYMKLDEEATENMKKASTMKRDFLRNTGMVFTQ